ncbi:hypothetical protein QCN29_33140 [Streptomyces sp. HNM0663]|uniref:Uncharacterized protein n=1 Tax=Streptomyces chengmaiensis TaxID=3040919 RepID=A0ABT6HYX8_9ACTN|nr:hypothetical protein [Streptomyces chengmaiensis]MDH2393527.1 hypothetical protein [Streptomyces chengmaiensis]
MPPPSKPPSAEPAGDGKPSPIYEQLAREWAAAGRMLPGRPDAEWTRLSRYPFTHASAGSGGHAGPPSPRKGWLVEPHPT